VHTIIFKNNTAEKIHLGSPLKIGVSAGETVNLTENFTHGQIDACKDLEKALTNNYGTTGYEIGDGAVVSSTVAKARSYIAVQNKGPIN